MFCGGGVQQFVTVLKLSENFFSTSELAERQGGDSSRAPPPPAPQVDTGPLKLSINQISQMCLKSLTSCYGHFVRSMQLS